MHKYLKFVPSMATQKLNNIMQTTNLVWYFAHAELIVAPQAKYNH